MRTRIEAIALALGLGLGATACGDFLTGPKLGDNPNQPLTATDANLLVSAQTSMTGLQEGHLARTICVWLQQCSGPLRDFNDLSLYIVGDDDYFIEWKQVYTRGGLKDLRTIQSRALAAGDSGFAGVAAVLEAWAIGFAADAWGDVPYSETLDATKPTPALDPQQNVYAAVQAKLDDAILYLNATSTGTPVAVDLVYRDADGVADLAKWTALANTLKARYHLHTAEQLGPAAYQAASDAAQNGIADASGAGDYLDYHSGASVEANLWFQFTIQWQGFLAAGRQLVDQLQTAGDPRLARYFAPNSEGNFVGIDPGDGPELLPSDLNASRLNPTFRQPIVTYAENQLILAEAAWQIAGGGGAGNVAAQPYVTAERSALGLGPLVVGSLDDIMLEKYAVLFQNIEAWSDYRRTCLPALAPAAGSSAIPARVVYPLSERNANTSIADGGPLKNWNDPNDCP